MLVPPLSADASGQIKHKRLLSSVGNGAVASVDNYEVRTEDKLS